MMANAQTQVGHRGSGRVGCLAMVALAAFVLGGLTGWGIGCAGATRQEADFAHSHAQGVEAMATPKHRRAIRLDSFPPLARLVAAQNDDQRARELAEWSRQCEAALIAVNELPPGQDIGNGRFTVAVSSGARRWLIDGGYGPGQADDGSPVFVVWMACAALDARNVSPSSADAEEAMRLLRDRLHRRLPMAVSPRAWSEEASGG